MFPKYLSDVFDSPLFSLGGTPFTVGTLLGLIAALIAVQLFSGWLRRWMPRRLLIRGHLDPDTRETIASLSRYSVLVIGAMLVLEQAGVHLSSFTVLAGALGVGVGFGLQNIFSNFVSGLIVMFERPVRLGDHIAVAGIEGDVIEIGMRATRLRTAQGSEVIVPNQNFITGNVVNWNSGGVSAAVLQWRMSGDVSDNESLVLGLLRAHPGVVRSPEPSACIITADHAGYLLEAHFGTVGDAGRRLATMSDIHRVVLDELARSGRTLASNP